MHSWKNDLWNSSFPNMEQNTSYENSFFSNSKIPSSQWTQEEMELSVLTQSSPKSVMRNWDALDLFSQLPDPVAFSESFSFQDELYQAPCLSPIPINYINFKAFQVGEAVNDSIKRSFEYLESSQYVDKNDFFHCYKNCAITLRSWIA